MVPVPAAECLREADTESVGADAHRALPLFCGGSTGHVEEMLKNPRTRRITAVILVVLGAILMLVAPEIWAGLVVLVLGVALELAGIALGHKVNNKAS